MKKYQRNLWHLLIKSTKVIDGRVKCQNVEIVTVKIINIKNDTNHVKIELMRTLELMRSVLSGFCNYPIGMHIICLKTVSYIIKQVFYRI